MKTQIIKYGTKHTVKVLQANSKVIIVVADDNGEGYVLMGHGLKTLPEVDEIGTITFIKSNTPMNGHWEYHCLGEATGNGKDVVGDNTNHK